MLVCLLLASSGCSSRSDGSKNDGDDDGQADDDDGVGDWNPPEFDPETCINPSICQCLVDADGPLPRQAAPGDGDATEFERWRVIPHELQAEPDCSEDLDCGINQVCFGDSCIDSIPCTGDDDCRADASVGDFCEDEFCRPKRCSSGCPVGSHCTNQGCAWEIDQLCDSPEVVLTPTQLPLLDTEEYEGLFATRIGTDSRWWLGGDGATDSVFLTQLADDLTVGARLDTFVSAEDRGKAIGLALPPDDRAALLFHDRDRVVLAPVVDGAFGEIIAYAVSIFSSLNVRRVSPVWTNDEETLVMLAQIGPPADSTLELEVQRLDPEQADEPGFLIPHPPTWPSPEGERVPPQRLRLRNCQLSVFTHTLKTLHLTFDGEVSIESAPEGISADADLVSYRIADDPDHQSAFGVAKQDLVFSLAGRPGSIGVIDVYVSPISPARVLPLRGQDGRVLQGVFDEAGDVALADGCWQTYDGVGEVRGATVGDFDGDGDDDIVTRNADGSMWLWRQDAG